MIISQDWITGLLPLLMILIIGIIVGVVIGGMIASSTRNAGQTQIKTDRRHLKPLVYLYRDKRSDKIVVEVDGKILSAEKLTMRQKTALLQVADDFNFWLGSGDMVKRLEDLPASPIKAEAPTISSAVDVPSTIQEVVQVSSETPLTVQPPSMEVSDILSRALAPDPKLKIDSGTKSLAAQVDEIVQDRLRDSPLSSHLIRLSETPRHEIIVVVDSNMYEGINEVPDPEIRKFIQDCVAEWERSQ